MFPTSYGESGKTALIDPFMFDRAESRSLHHNIFVQDVPEVVALPDFDLHAVEEALLVNHRLYEGCALTREEAIIAVQQYREFLHAHKVAGMPDQFEVPSLLIDRVWHTHMCETRQYAADCQAYFGKFFHHASGICNGDLGD